MSVSGKMTPLCPKMIHKVSWHGWESSYKEFLGSIFFSLHYIDKKQSKAKAKGSTCKQLFFPHADHRVFWGMQLKTTKGSLSTRDCLEKKQWKLVHILHAVQKRIQRAREHDTKPSNRRCLHLIIVLECG